VRLLRVNNIFQTEMNLKTKHSVSSYVSLLDTLIPRAVGSKNALVLGLGGGLTANLLEEKKYKTDAVEIDERIIEVAKNFFFLNKNVNAIEEDARYFLNKMKKKYDIILVDVFKAEEQPSHILTSESLVKLRNNLSDSALLLINWHGYTNANLGLGTSILNNTLLKAGFTVQLCSKIKDENTRNIIFVASSKALANMPFRLNEKLAMTNLLNTDNLPLLEKYNAEANKIWRTNYLRFYQRSNNYQ
jgi:predicted membrane-bound spermidine synthase